MPSNDQISFTVSYRGTQHTFSFPPDTNLASLQEHLEELTNVPLELQKLLCKGKILPSSAAETQRDLTLTDAGIKAGLKIQMLGSTSQELTTLRSTEEDKKKRDRILQERALKAPVKLRSTGPSDKSSSSQYRFHELVPLLHLPDPSGALGFLKKLSEDPAIQHVMQKHNFSVGILTELAPHEHPQLLGLNVNNGQAIKLRLRTNKYDGFRLYSEVRRVLCHELAHNVWNDHDEHFKAFNSKLNREVAEFERAVMRGMHSLIGKNDHYEPTEEDLAVDHGVHTYVVGEGSGSERPPSDETMEERRQRVLDATMSRLQKGYAEGSPGTGQQP